MKKIIYLLLLGICLSNCAYKPVIDTAGRSGTFDHSKSNEITNDLQHCKTLAENNTNMLLESTRYVWNYYFRSATLWLSPKAEYNYPKLYRNCLINRGHSVVN